MQAKSRSKSSITAEIYDEDDDDDDDGDDEINAPKNSKQFSTLNSDDWK